MFGIVSFLVVFISLSLLIILHEAGHFIAAKLAGIFVEEFGFGLPPRITGKHWGETLISLNWLPFGGFVRVYGEQHAEENAAVPIDRSFSHKPFLVRIGVIAAGVAMNFLLGWFLLSAVFMIGIPKTLLVDQVADNSVAAAAGIHADDQILGYATVADLTSFLDAHVGEPVELQILRDGSKINITADLRSSYAPGEGKLGVYLEEAGVEPTGFWRGITEGLSQAAQISAAIGSGFLMLIGRLLTGKSVLDLFVGPVGVVSTAMQTTKLGIASFLQLMALISLNLAVLNILPLPALDGGKLLFLCIEKISGRKNEYLEGMVNAIGFLILIALALIITGHDILKLL
ncbi:MAG: site-2 protease family protein [Patescibacteria group bacterium]|nr:site-2 protease family protein [Patescibacteria group bacterium]